MGQEKVLSQKHLGLNFSFSIFSCVASHITSLALFPLHCISTISPSQDW